MSVEIYLNIKNNSAERAIQEVPRTRGIANVQPQTRGEGNLEYKVIQSLGCLRVHKLTTSS